MAKGDSSRNKVTIEARESQKASKTFNYVLIGLVAASLLISIVSLVNTRELKTAVTGNVVSTVDFLEKLTSHTEMKSYVGVAPLNIVQITGNNLGNLQSQIGGLDASNIGDFIVQYTDRIVLYNYDSDTLKGSLALEEQLAIPSNILSRASKHNEFKGLEKEKPIGGQLDGTSLDKLKEQFPDVYKDAKVGDYLLRYSTRLIIYDYNQDRVVNAINLG